MTGPARTYPAALLVVLLAASLLAAPLSRADPAIADEGGGFKRATWDFSTGADYTAANASLAPGNATLATRPGSRSYANDVDFSTARESEVLAEVRSGVRLTGATANLVADGQFNQSAGPWAFANSSGGHVRAEWDTGRARFSHTDPQSPFDSMDNIAASSWGVTQSVGVVVGTFQDTTVFVEGTGSMRLALDYTGNPTGFGGGSRDEVGTWDLSLWNRLAVWINANATGLRAYLFLQNLGGANPWPSADQPITTGWNRYVFDYSGFPGDAATIDILQLRFTRTTGLQFTAYVDDLRTFNETLFDEAASVSQTFTKPNATSGTPGAFVLTFDVDATPAAFLTAYLQVTVGGSVHWAESPVATGARSLYVDLSGDPLLRPAGAYLLEVSLQLTRVPGQEASMSLWLDDIAITAIDHRNGSFTAIPIDAGSEANWATATLAKTTPPGTDVTVSTRTGPDGAAWSGWQAAVGGAIQSPPARFLQWRLDLTTANGSLTPVATRLDLAWSRFADAGTVRTNAFLPADPLVAWREFLAADVRPAGASVTYEVSFDGGGNWTVVTDGEDLSAAPRAAATVRATLSTANTSVAPSIASFALRYEYFGPLFSISVQPPSTAMTADDTAVFTATAFDEWGHTLTSFGCVWRWNDPWGSVTGNGTLTGTYAAGKEGTWEVRCENANGSVFGSATVNVTPGALARVVVRPPAALVPVAQTAGFTAEGEDADGNPVALTATAWSTTLGQVVSANATAATVRAPPLPGTGTVTATHGAASGNAQIVATPEGTPRINGTILEQAVDEDAPPWRLDLMRFAGNQPDANDSLDNLRWYLTGVDASLYSVYGQNEFGRHDLWFTPRMDAHGADLVRFWLEDRDGARAYQDVTVRIRPVNDAPVWTEVPDVYVQAGEAYTLDVAPYVRDVDRPPDLLALTTEDPAHIRTDGMNATYNYTSTYLDRTLYVRHTVSDGAASSAAVVTIHVTDNPPPQVSRPMPDRTLTEDVPLVDAFPESLRYYFFDPKGEQLFFSHNFTNLAVAIWDDGTKVRVNITGAPDFCGLDRITFRATDPGGAFAEYTVRVEVACVNDPPVLAWSGDVHVQFDRPYRLDFAPFASDVDNAPEELAIASSDPAAAVDRLAVTFLYTRYDLERRFGPSPTYAVPVDLTLSDPTASAAPVRVTVRVSDNRPPEVIAPIPAVQMNEDETRVGAIDLRQHFADVDNLPLAYAASGRQVSPTLAGPLVTLTPLRDWFGQEVLVFRATDAAGAFAIATALVDVLPVNDAPRLAAIPDQAGDAGRPWVLDLRPYVTDVDNELSELVFTTDDARVAAIGFVLLFDFPQAASLDVVVTVSDGAAEAPASVRVTVWPPDSFGALLPWTAVLLFAVAAVGYVVWTRVLHRYAIEDVFLISKEGRLVMHTTRRLRADRDEDILAGMLTAIMLFVRDSFREENEDLKRFEFGDRKVAVERSDHVIGAAIFSGEVPRGISAHVTAFLEDVEARYGDALVRWSGDVEDLPGLRDMMEEFGRRGRWRAGSWR